jgi:CelD/BcsL family acetyltransferase involved in cellulose biosynthesis
MTDQASVLPADRRFGESAGVDRREAARSLGRIEVYENPADASLAWAELEAIAPASAYQTRKWLVPWIETVGRQSGVCPMIVVAHGTNGSPVALFPFGIVHHGSVRLVNFLGGRDSNTNLGLIRPDTQLNKSDIVSLLRAAAHKARMKPDAFVLSNQPKSWEGVLNPLALLQHQRSPSECHSATLNPNGENFVDERLSADACKKLRKKRKRLSELGPVSHIVARTPDDVARIIDAFFAQKLERFRQKNISSDFEAPETRQFLLRACLDGVASDNPAIELHALAAGDRIVAVYAGAPHRGRFHAMINSFDVDPEVARTSPGDLLLMSMMQTMCDRNYEAFDLGIGEARYKSSWCDQSEPLLDTLYGVTLKGHAYVLCESARLRLKGYIKQNEWAWKTVQKLRESSAARTTRRTR